MAANFWTSTHAKLLLPKERLLECHAKDRAKGLSNDQLQQILVYHVNYIEDLAKSCLPPIRQSAQPGDCRRVVAVAVVYFQRFFSKNSFCEYDPRKVAPACLFLACKACETQVQPKTLFHFMKRLSGAQVLAGAGKYAYMPAIENKHFLELEMAIMEELDFCLLIFTPYLPLEEYLKATGLADIGKTAWSVLNDSLRTYVPLTHAPHIIALGCIVVACTLEKRETKDWLESMEVNLNQVYEVTMEIMTFYDKFREQISSEACNRYMELLKL